MTAERFRRIALSLPEATEESHMDHPDFRVGRKIFATLWADGKTGVVMLSPEQQRSVCHATPTVFAPVKGGWGAKGATMVHLDQADEAAVASALLTAWRNRAPSSLCEASDLAAGSSKTSRR